MKRKALLAAGFYMFAVLTACQLKKSPAEAHWKEAAESKDFYTYAAEHAGEIELSQLADEAGGADGSLSRQYQAVSLLCALEYSSGSGRSTWESEELYQFDYPESGAYAEQFLKKVTEDKDEFWSAIDKSFYPYDCFGPLFAAAGHLDGQTIAQLFSSIPEDAGYAGRFKEAVDQWVKENPENIVDTKGDLMQAGYFDSWIQDDWNKTYLNSSLNEDKIRTYTIEEAVSYARFMREDVLPMLTEEYGADGYREKSKITKKNYYTTNLTVTIDEDIKLKEQGKKKLPESIPLKGKKVAAFYYNPYYEEWEDSPARLRLLGDFMLGLTKKECPASLDEADYYLVLTPHYSYGDFYQNTSGKDTKIQEVYSSTSIDLYKAGSGKFLRHLGSVLENPPSQIFKNLAEEAAQYPDLITADLLLHMYRNINDPNAYAAFADHTSELSSELAAGDPVIIGGWEITYRSSQAVKSFDEGMFRYTADDGCQYVRAEFSVKNLGSEENTFLPMIYQVAEDPVVKIADAERETVFECVDALNDSRCLNSTSLEPGESKDGELIFQVSDEALANDDPLYVVVSMGRQEAAYRLNK